jgi:hypothetical protein
LFYNVSVVKSKRSLHCALLILGLALFASLARAEQTVTVKYIKSGMTIIDALDLWGTAHSDNAPITNIFVTLGGVKIVEQPYPATYGQTISFEFSSRIHPYGELTLVVTAQDASGATFSSQTFTDYFASELNVRLLAPPPPTSPSRLARVYQLALILKSTSDELVDSIFQWITGAIIQPRTSLLPQLS